MREKLVIIQCNSDNGFEQLVSGLSCSEVQNIAGKMHVIKEWNLKAIFTFKRSKIIHGTAFALVRIERCFTVKIFEWKNKFLRF